MTAGRRRVMWYLLRVEHGYERDLIVTSWRDRFSATSMITAIGPFDVAVQRALSLVPAVEHSEQVLVIEFDDRHEEEQLLAIRFIVDCNGLIMAAWQEESVLVTTEPALTPHQIREAIDHAAG